MPVPFVPNEHVVEVEFRAIWDSQKVENTLYFRQAGTPGIIDMLALAAELASWYSDEISPLQCSVVSLNEIVVTSLESETAPRVVYTSGLPLPGEFTGECMPNEVTWAIKFNTVGRGRSSRGRNFVLGIPRTNVAGNDIDVALAGNYVDAYLAVIPRVAGLATEWTWVVYSRRVDMAWRTEGLPQDVISVSFSDLIIDSQRRRSPGRGN